MKLLVTLIHNKKEKGSPHFYSDRIADMTMHDRLTEQCINDLRALLLKSENAAALVILNITKLED